MVIKPVSDQPFDIISFDKRVRESERLELENCRKKKRAILRLKALGKNENEIIHVFGENDIKLSRVGLYFTYNKLSITLQVLWNAVGGFLSFSAVKLRRSGRG